ncbi:MAG: sensor histidine kinase [Candidatus Zixiibacteriota bacterium]
MSENSLFKSQQNSARIEFYLLLVSLFIMIVLAATFAIFHAFFFKHVESMLNGISAENLITLSSAISKSIEPSMIRDIETGDFTLERIESESLLDEIYLSEKLDNIYIVDTVGNIIYSSDNSYKKGGKIPYLALSESAFAAAVTGISATSKLIQHEQHFLRFSFSPIYDELENLKGILILESGADFYSGFRNLRSLSRVLTVFFIIIEIFFIFIIINGFFMIRRLRTRLQKTAALAAVNKMTASIAHEIRNPLQIIRSSAKRMVKKENQKEREVYLSYIQDEILRLSKLTDRYLSLTNRSSPKREVMPSKIIEDIVQNYRESLSDREISLKYEIVHNESISINKDSFIQIIHNLVKNAIEILGDKGEVVVHQEKQGDRLRISIIDNSKNWAVKHPKRLFEPFYTTKKSGTGLGLYITKTLVEQDNGEITVQRKNGRTYFNLLYPVSKL